MDISVSSETQSGKHTLNMLRFWCLVAVYIAFYGYECHGHIKLVTECELRADIDTGSVCGRVKRYDTYQGNSKFYGSFRGIPYAKQPLGDLRFKELEPLEPWSGILDASEEGPICPQTDVLYMRLMNHTGMSEECIHANVHVPLDGPLERHFNKSEAGSSKNATGLPVIVFVHGGGFAFGSGNADIHGPEYMMDREVIVVTFNYRLGIFGFLSLDTPDIPGNAGLRDMVTLLKWVNRNIASFGGNPNDVTLVGQSAGASAVHLLTLSNSTKGLIHKAIAMSGTGVRTFFTPSKDYGQKMVQMFLLELGMQSTNANVIYNELKNMPLANIIKAHKKLLDQNGLGAFYPTIENRHKGITTIVDDDPERLMQLGRGKHIPIIFTFTKSECDTFRNRFKTLDIVNKIQINKFILVPPSVLFTTPLQKLSEKVQVIEENYFKQNISMDTFVNYCSDSYFVYPAFFAARKRAEIGGAPIYLAQFSYKGAFRAIARGLGLNLDEASHIEDLTYLFKVHSVPDSPARTLPGRHFDIDMQKWLTTLYTDFAKQSNPTDYWPPLTPKVLKYQDIRHPMVLDMSPVTDQQRNMLDTFSKLYTIEVPAS